MYIETKIRYDKVQENGAVKKVTEHFLVDALTFTEAEARITEEASQFVSGEFTVNAVKKSRIGEIFFDDAGDRFYQVKAAFISINERTGAEKRSNNFFLVQAVNFQDALDNFNAGMRGTMADFEIVSIAETKILDVYRVKLS